MNYLLVFATISLVILLHELGHLLAAKRVGIPIARFSLGLGPKIWGFKLGGIEYCVSLIPFGGYVLPVLEDEQAWERIPLRNRLVFSVAGPVANVVAALIGLSLMNVVQLGFSFHAAVYLPLEQIAKMSVEMCKLIPMLFTQPDQLSGIVGIVAAGGAYVGLNLVKLAQFFVLLNLNLAILNMLPILPLDGGKIVMGLLRKIYQPLRKLEIPLSVGGWVALLALMLYTTIADIARVTQGMLG